MARIKHVLFVCVQNAGRSQMAEAFANHYGRKKLVASSAGVMLTDRVNPLVVEVMKEKGIDISTNKPKLLTTKMIEEADKVITMGCSVEKFCPAPLRQKRDRLEPRRPERKTHRDCQKNTRRNRNKSQKADRRDKLKNLMATYIQHKKCQKSAGHIWSYLQHIMNQVQKSSGQIHTAKKKATSQAGKHQENPQALCKLIPK